jgi:hypothetical protein
MLQQALRLKPDGVGVVVVGAEAVGTEATPTTVGVGMAAIPPTGTDIHTTVVGPGGVRVSGLGSAFRTLAKLFMMGRSSGVGPSLILSIR